MMLTNRAEIPLKALERSSAVLTFENMFSPRVFQPFHISPTSQSRYNSMEFIFDFVLRSTWFLIDSLLLNQSHALKPIIRVAIHLTFANNNTQVSSHIEKKRLNHANVYGRVPPIPHVIATE